MCSADSGAAFANAATALNEVTRLEEVRFESSAEDWQEMLAGLGAVISSAARLADCLGGHLAGATDHVSWRDGVEPNGHSPGELLGMTAATVHQISATLTGISHELDAATDQVALLHVITRRRGGGSDPAADAGRA
ncbi:MAG TPA: hypothetical protein VGD34_02430 [Kribbella sp.]|jgi:hypothetical protein